MATSPISGAMHILLDMVAAFDEHAEDDMNRRATQKAFQRFNEIDAVTATFDEEADEVSLEITPLLTAAGVSIDVLLRQLAIRLSQDRLTVLGSVRQHLDELLADG